MNEKPAQVGAARTKAQRTQDSSTGGFERWGDTVVQTVGLAPARPPWAWQLTAPLHACFLPRKMETVRVAACRAVVRTELRQGKPSELAVIPVSLVGPEGRARG